MYDRFILSAFLLFLSIPLMATFEDERTEISILALGDSLTAGYGLPFDQGFTEQLEKYLSQNSGCVVKVVNAGVSGDTSQGGANRLDWSLAPFGLQGPDLVLVELGANDALRGIDPNRTLENMDRIAKTLKEKSIPTIIAGMFAPPNMGISYQKEFDPIFANIAQRYDHVLYPFFLEGVAANADLNQGDGIHPNATGVKIIVENISPVILNELKKQSNMNACFDSNV